MSDEPPPEPDRLPGAPHPRETQVLYGQSQAQADFMAAHLADKRHAAWLITGPRGIGKATLAWKIAAFLLVGAEGDAKSDDPMFVAPDNPVARLIAAGAHPRLALIRRPWDEKTKKLRAEITVDAVRALKQFFQMSAADAGHRVVIVDAADELNRNAANAILKELEEPPANCTLLLIAHQPARLIPTIRSRCRVLRCAPLGSDDLARALAQAGHPAAAADSLGALAQGSAGDAISLMAQDGLALYAQLIALLDGIPRLDRAAAVQLAESCAVRGAEARFALVLDLIDRALARIARAGLTGAPAIPAAPGEGALLGRLAPDAAAARAWADLQQNLTERARHGRAVNLDPASLILDILFKIEETAQATAVA